MEDGFMETFIYLLITIPIGLGFSILGIYAWKRKKPMWFWSGTEVKASEISDVKAYNKANGIMWIIYSLVFWAGAILGVYQIDIAGIVVAAGCLGGIPLLVLAYTKIYNKYRIRK